MGRSPSLASAELLDRQLTHQRAVFLSRDKCQRVWITGGSNVSRNASRDIPRCVILGYQKKAQVSLDPVENPRKPLKMIIVKMSQDPEYVSSGASARQNPLKVIRAQIERVDQ